MSPTGVQFSELQKVCEHYFGKPRQSSKYYWQLRKLRWVMITEIDKYTYRVTWSEEDREFVGLCAEFPGLSWLDQTPENALKGARSLVSECIDDMEKSSESIPEPIAIRQAIEDADLDVSLNRITSAKLAH